MKKALFMAVLGVIAGVGFAHAAPQYKLPETINSFFGALNGTQHEVRLVEDSARKVNCYVLITKGSANSSTIVPPAISCVPAK